jgi:transcriptional regulator with XRE-family HTH domain
MDVREAKDLGLLIRDRRVLLGWSQRHLALRAGVGRQWVVGLEKGKAAAPLHLLIPTLKALGLVIRIFDDMPTRLAVIRHLDSEPRPRVPRNGAVAPLPDATTSLGVADKSAAAGQVGPQHSTLDVGPAYQPTNFASLGVTVSKDTLYELEYRPVIQRMVDHVIRSEGPVFEDLVARRIARAHDLARATAKLLQITRVVTDPSFARSSEGQRSIIWPGPEPLNLLPFRSAPKEVRDHSDVPLVELASLAGSFMAEGYTPSKAAELMCRRMGLTRIAKNTRSRFEAAAELARCLG